MKNINLIICILFLFNVKALAQPKAKWVNLFNGKNLNGWDTYLGPELDSAGNRISKIPVGLNKDPMKVFTVVEQNGENIIRISGQNWGGISTKKEFANYHLQLKFKWGQLTWGKKRGLKKDSGLLYHAVGEQGAQNTPWMRSQEFQIEEGNTGDYWGVSGAVQDIPAIFKGDKNYVYSPAGNLVTFSVTSTAGRHCMKSVDAEAPSGEWNTLDLYCFEDRSIYMVNGKVVMRLFNSSQSDNGQTTPLTKGKIQIQSEGAEIFYKQIKLQGVKQMPASVLKIH